MSRVVVGLFVLVCVVLNTGYSQMDKKPTVAVVEFEVRGDVQIKDAGISIAEMLSVSLVKTGVYNLFERILIEKVLAEQKLGNAQIVNAETAAKVGEMYGVNFLITGSVIEWDKVYTVTVRMIDTSTGKIVNSASFQVSKSSEIPGKMNDLADVLVGRKNAEVLKASGGVSSDYVKKTSGLGIILDIRKDDGNQLIINQGTDQNVKEGMLFDVFVNKYKISKITGLKTSDGTEKVGEMVISSADPTMSIGPVYLNLGKGAVLDTLPQEGVVTYHFPASSFLTIGIVDFNTPIVSYDFNLAGFIMSVGMGYAIPNFLGNTVGSFATKIAYGLNVYRSPLDAINIDIKLSMLIYTAFDYRTPSKFMKFALNADVKFLNFLYVGAGGAYDLFLSGPGGGFGLYLEGGVSFPLF
ncbi:MAG: hypothetical protein HPY53_11910 [Brevinematales bacterium]|nr:hypothetical protein [Brevinematales bacterium]